MTNLKIYLQQSHRFQDFFHSDKSAKEQATLVNAQTISTKVQGKTSFETKLNNVNQTFDFLLFMWFLDFWHKIRKWLIKSNNVKTTKTDKAIIITIITTIVQQSSVWPTNKVTWYKQVKHTSHKRFKGLYQRQWSYGGIQTVDHREAWWRCSPFNCLCG